jgi:DNA invertase Pin-like site-specific DNA recombinase
MPYHPEAFPVQPNPPIAYSYVRFSTPEQLKGDSLRRQTEAAADWCRRHQVALDTSTTFRDLGRSAYTGSHRANPDRNALAAFLKLVEGGKVSRGSYLVIENLDRLSREHIQPALLLVLNLLQAGVRVVQLKPAELVFDDRSDTLPVMMMMLELSRGHGESAMKSERVGKAWAAKKEAARRGEPQPAKRDNRVNGMSVITHKLPAWVEEHSGKLRLIPERAAVVKRIFELAVAGYSCLFIVKKLNAENVPPMGRAKHWLRTYIGRILGDRRALGEFQPGHRYTHRGDRKDGDPIPGYFPAVVTEAEWLAARAGAGQRRFKPGRIGARVNLFAGLLKDARDGMGFWRLPPGPKRPEAVLANNGSHEGVSQYRSFPEATFERAILSCLAEIDPHEILNGDSGPDESLALAGELAQVEAKIAEIETELLNGDVAALAKVLRRLETRKGELAEKLATARKEAAHPLSESWGETQSLLAMLDSAADPTDARLRLRSALRRIVSGIWMLVVGRSIDRLAAVQLWFTGDKRCRDYLILHRPAKSNGKNRVEGGWWVRSLASVAKPGKLDLRKPGDAARLEKALLAAELPATTETPGG